MFAILGTAISAMVVGGGIYLLGQVRASVCKELLNKKQPVTIAPLVTCQKFNTQGIVVHSIVSLRKSLAKDSLSLLLLINLSMLIFFC